MRIRRTLSRLAVLSVIGVGAKKLWDRFGDQVRSLTGRTEPTVTDESDTLDD